MTLNVEVARSSGEKSCKTRMIPMCKTKEYPKKNVVNILRDFIIFKNIHTSKTKG